MERREVGFTAFIAPAFVKGGIVGWLGTLPILPFLRGVRSLFIILCVMRGGRLLWGVCLKKLDDVYLVRCVVLWCKVEVRGC